MDEVLAKHLLQHAFATGQIQRASLPRGWCVALQWDGAQLTVTISPLHGRVRDAELQDMRNGFSIRYYVAFWYVCAPPETAHVADDQVVTVA